MSNDYTSSHSSTLFVPIFMLSVTGSFIIASLIVRYFVKRKAMHESKVYPLDKSRYQQKGICLPNYCPTICPGICKRYQCTSTVIDLAEPKNGDYFMDHTHGPNSSNKLPTTKSTTPSQFNTLCGMNSSDGGFCHFVRKSRLTTLDHSEVVRSESAKSQITPGRGGIAIRESLVTQSNCPKRMSTSSAQIRKLHLQKRQNRALLTKYRRYLEFIRKQRFNNKKQLVVSMQGNRTTTSVNTNQDGCSVSESPWIRASDVHETKSGISRRTNSSISSSTTICVPQISPRAHDVSNILADLTIQCERVVLNRVIVEGTFGKLYEAKLYTPCKKRQIYFEKWKKVLVKALSDQATDEQVRIFMDDACKLAGLKHRRLATIIASCQPDRSWSVTQECGLPRPWFVYPYAEPGNLKHFLRKTVSGSVETQSAVGLTANQLVRMGLDIISAVDHLHQMKILHGDIATRNCVLNVGLRVSLSDSALSRDFFPEDYHCLGDNTNRPIKWLAVEALVERKFSTATDVWAIGVTLWELITKGQQPYEMFDAFEMPNLLCAGYRLAQPPNCPDDLWKIIRPCWKMPASLRPSTAELKTRLMDFKQTVDNYI